MKIPTICRYCGGKIIKSTTRALYPKGSEPIYLCVNCNAYVGCYEDDGSLSKEELRQLRRIHAAAARFQAELQREMEKRHVPTAKRLSAGCRSQKDGEYDALI